jgi:hypothetical protein
MSCWHGAAPGGVRAMRWDLPADERPFGAASKRVLENCAETIEFYADLCGRAGI